MAWVVPSNPIRFSQLPTVDYNHNDICFGKYFKAINRFGKIVLSSAFMIGYKTLDTMDGSLPIKDYCLQKQKWSNTKYRETFNTSERENLSKNPKADDFNWDISLAYKVIWFLLADLMGSLIKNLRDLKNMRNMVCHEDLEMDENELKNRFDNLNAVCRTILLGVGSLMNHDVGDLVKNVEDGLQDLFEAKLDILDVESYLQDVENFRKEKHSKMISEGRKELMNAYSKFKILNPCTWLSDNKFTKYTVDKIFTGVKLVEGNTVVKVNEILNITSRKERFVARLMILSGVMGAGKTSLHRYLLDEWCKRTPSIIGLSAFDMVIAIEMRTVSSGSLVQFLREQLLISTCRSFSESDIIPVLQDMNVLFAIDGMDEANINGKAIIKEIAHKFTNSQIIVTTRPEHTIELMHMVENHIVLRIEGFDYEKQVEFVEKVFASVSSGDNPQEFLQYMSTTCKPLMGHFNLPLTLALLLVLWFDDSTDMSTISTITHLHSKIFEMCQQKLVSRLESRGEGHTLSLTRKVQRFMLELGKVAWNMIEEDLLYVSKKHENDLMNVCDKEGLDHIETMSAFLNCQVKDTITGNIYTFSFHHSSAVVFLAAMYMADRAGLEGSLGIFFNEIDCTGYQELVLYLTGILKRNNSLNMKFASQLKSALISAHGTIVSLNDFNIWWNLVREGEKDQSLCQMVGSIINQCEHWSVNSWDPEEVTDAKMNLLKETHAAPCEVAINVKYTTAFHDCPVLQQIISYVTEAEKSYVKIYLDHDFNEAGNADIFDQYFTPLLKINRLVEFKGYIGEDFAKNLVSASNLQFLSVRVSSIEVLVKLCNSIKKHRRWKVKLMPSRRWTLKYIELFLDLNQKANASKIPSLKFHRTLIVKMTGVSDTSANWAGEVLRRLNDQYNSVILQDSSLTHCGIEKLLHEVKGVKIKTFRVMSEHDITNDTIKQFAKKSNINIGWRKI